MVKITIVHSKLRLMLQGQETTQITRKLQESSFSVQSECVMLDFNENEHFDKASS